MRATTVTWGMIAALVAVSSAKAEPVFMLFSTSDLSNVAVGDTITFDGQLADLTAGDELQLLAAGVQYDPGRFALSGNVRAGELASDLSDASSFDSSAEGGAIDVILDVLPGNSADRITSNGTFFSFDLTALQNGATEISLDFVDALRFDPADPSRPTEVNITAGPALQVTVGGGAVIPLPNGLATGVVSGTIIGLGCLVRQAGPVFWLARSRKRSRRSERRLSVASADF